MKTILTLTCLLIFTTLLNAQRAGSLDSSFGVNGIVRGEVGECHAMIVLRNNEIIALGEPGLIHNEIISLMCFKENGSIDSAFGINGIVNTIFKPYNYINCIGFAEQSDGKIIVVENENDNWFANILLVRYEANGKIDSSFGNDGFKEIDLGSGEFGAAVKVDNKNRIVIAGYQETWHDKYEINMMVLRCKPNGELDSSFRINGASIPTIRGDSLWEEATALVFQNDGKIVVGGKIFSSDYNLPRSKFLITRFLEDGKPDSSFNSCGGVSVQVTEKENMLSSIQLKSDGKIIAVGYSSEEGTSNYSYAYTGISLVQLTSSGVIDSLFGHNGKMVTRIPLYSSYAEASALQPDDKIIVGSFTFKRNPEGPGEFMLSRYLVNGYIDTSFGNKGITITAFTNGELFSIALQNTEKIITAGYSYYEGSEFSYFTLARFYNDINQSIVGKNKRSKILTSDTTTSKVSLVPNPVNSMLTINGLSESTKYDVRITNESGNTVVHKQISNVSSYQINVQGLSAGVYYINIISNNNQSTTLKFIKQ